MRTIKIHKNPLCLTHNMYAKDTIDMQTGLTVLVGCNGSGKTTFLTQLKDYLYSKHIPFLDFDNLLHGGVNSRDDELFRHNLSFVIASATSSEGENIVLNMSKMASKIGAFIENNPEAKELWVLMDAVDSGLSIDNIVDIKKCLFEPLMKDPRNANRDVYIVVSANTYEMTSGQ